MQRTYYVSFPFCHVTLRAQKPLAPEYPRELKTLGDHIRRRRLDLGLLQRDVGNIIGVAQGTVMVWEGNRRPIAPRLVPDVLAFLGYEPYLVVSSVLKSIGSETPSEPTQDSSLLLAY